MDQSNDTKEGRTNSEDTTGMSRRRFLQKAGKYAVYTPPAMMVLMKPGFAGQEHKGSWTGRPNSSWSSHPDNSWRGGSF